MIFLKNNQGGLLLDLVVVSGIFALLATISIPYLRKYQPNLKLNAAARALTTDLRYAQQLTVTEQKVHLVEFDAINGEYEILKIDAATTTVKTVILDQEVSIKQITDLIDNQAIFNFYGGVSQPGNIILTNTNNIDATVSIKPSGYVQLYE